MESIKAEPSSFRELRLAIEKCLARQHQLLDNQILRLGRLTAFERTAHLLLEVHARLKSVDLCHERAFVLPATQETLADILGLSPVHVNRTLQHLKRDGFVRQEGPRIQLCNIERLAFLCDYADPAA
jgi:CRP-like cAMP-binding protein